MHYLYFMFWCREKPWVRPPVSLDFQIEMYSCSGVQVRFLKVYEKSSYNTNRWVKYVTKAGNGEYQIRVWFMKFLIIEYV